jgi:hypothetical protein
MFYFVLFCALKDDFINKEILGVEIIMSIIEELLG